jgi:hypothetical protein
MLAFLRVNVARAGVTPLQRLDDREQLRDGRGEGVRFVRSGKGLFSAREDEAHGECQYCR